MNKLKKHISFILLVSILLVSNSSLIFASSMSYDLQQKSDVTVTVLDESLLLVNDKGNSSLIKVKQSGVETVITVEDLLTGDSHYFVRNEVDNTLYSSITGYTGTLDDPQSPIYLSAETEVDYISYKTLAAYVGLGAGAATILAGILAITSLPAAATGVVTIISGILTMINSGIALASSNSGLKITSEKQAREKHQGPGGPYIYYIYVVIGVSTY